MSSMITSHRAYYNNSLKDKGSNNSSVHSKASANQKP